MDRIQRLPASVVNKIAAGEVIERPASVVKELLENAVDAGATRIDVEVQDGGRELIRVVDNGSGILADDLPLAVASHATSKIASADDLFQVQTLGFRGEALASIAEVSELRLQSRPAAEPSGAQLEVIGGTAGEVRACGCPAGTAVEVRRLFFNTPVRRKFLRTTQTEMGHVAEAVTRLALGFPRLHLTLRHNAKTVFELPASAGLAERLALFFGRELAEHLIWVESEHQGCHLWGYVADPSQSRANQRMQYFFLAGRYIRDRSLAHALQEAYRGLLMTGRYAVAFLFIELPPADVDVNVHPTKLEVRFRDAQVLYSQLLSTLRQKFLSADLTARLRATGASPSHSAPTPPAGADPRRSLADWARGQVRDWPAATGDLDPPLQARRFDPDPNRSAASRPPAAPNPPPPSASAPHSPRTDPGSTISNSQSAPPDPQSTPHDSPPTTQHSPSATPHSPLTTHHSHSSNAIQLHNSYLVAETPDGMVVIDQHALHERVIYEELRNRLRGGSIESQRLLVPETVDLSAAECAAALEHRDLLAELGLEIEPFGGDTLLVRTYPAMLANLPPDRLLRDLLDQLTAHGRPPGREHLLDDLLHMIACKAAVKAGDRLTPAEMSALLDQRHLAHDSHHCPHGRPTALVFTKAELDKQFKRT